MNRRAFLQAGAGGLAWLSLRDHAWALLGQEPKRVGLIGSGWYGKCDLWRLIQFAPVEVVSLCDVDKKMLAEAADIAASRQASKKKPRTYTDYRAMLAEKDLDIVLIATPDHWHALAMIAAVEAGADVYCQKPISVDVVEGQAMVAAAQARARFQSRNPATEHAPSDRSPRPDHQGGQARQAESVSSRRTATIICVAGAIRRIRRLRITSTGRRGPGRPRCGPTMR